MRHAPRALVPEPKAGLSARLWIPVETESAAAFKARLAGLLSAPGTHVYIDTSFLMWATKIGTASRRELLSWLRGALAGRAHVPTWAGHEYLRHHVAGTIVTDLLERSKEVSSLAGKTFGYFRPFLDDPAVGFDEASEELRTTTRNAVNMLGKLVAAAQRWQRSYPVHAREIIDFINEASLEAGDLYARFETISVEGTARYEGRVPPGFRDKGKKGDSELDHENDGQDLSGANRFGDLLFWKEVLADATQRGAAAVIVLTNDRKNDWRMGGEDSALLDDAMVAVRKSWRPVPRVHPMLALEARAAGVSDLTLLDSQYLAAYLRDTPAEVAAFADVAIVPDPAPPQTEAERRNEAVARRQAEELDAEADRAAERVRAAGEHGHLFADDPLVKSSLVALGKALLASREPNGDRVHALLGRLRADAESGEPVRDVLTGASLAGLDHSALASLSRALHDRAVADTPGYTDALTDLLGLLDEVPPATAGAFTLGLLASMYLEPGSGDSRIPPRSPVARLLLARLGNSEAAGAVQTIRRRLLGNERRPVVVPEATSERLTVTLDIETHTMEENQLRSLKVGGLELLIAVQPDPELRLRDLFGDSSTTRARLLLRSAELYGLPRDRFPQDDDETPYALTADIGFRAPDTVFRTKEAGDA